MQSLNVHARICSLRCIFWCLAQNLCSIYSYSGYGGSAPRHQLGKFQPPSVPCPMHVRTDTPLKETLTTLLPNRRKKENRSPHPQNLTTALHNSGFQICSRTLFSRPLPPHVSLDALRSGRPYYVHSIATPQCL